MQRVGSFLLNILDEMPIWLAIRVRCYLHFLPAARESLTQNVLALDRHTHCQSTFLWATRNQRDRRNACLDTNLSFHPDPRSHTRPVLPAQLALS